MVLVRPGARARAVMEQEPYYTLLVRHGGDRHVKKIVREPKWGTSSPSVIVLESVNSCYFTRTHVNFRNTIAYGDIEIYRSNVVFS